MTRQWSLSRWLELETGLAAEQSRLKQRGSDVRQARRDRYLRPRAELRYRLSPVTRLDLGIERTVGQLDFEDFAASFNSDDDEVEAGNPDLEPVRAWELRGGLERQLRDELGRVGLRLFHHHVRHVVDRIPGCGGPRPGNVDRGRRYDFIAEVALALDAAGIAGAVLEAAWQHTESRLRDPFTGERRPFGELPEDVVTLEFRHDLAGWQAAYGIAVEYAGARFEFDDQEVQRKTEALIVEAFLEKRLPWGLRARVELDNLLDARERRRRALFERRAPGVAPDEIETEQRREGMSVRIVLEGRL